MHLCVTGVENETMQCKKRVTLEKLMFLSDQGVFCAVMHTQSFLEDTSFI